MSIDLVTLMLYSILNLPILLQEWVQILQVLHTGYSVIVIEPRS